MTKLIAYLVSTGEGTPNPQNCCLPNAQMQTIMARRLFYKFKQTIYVDFDQKVTYDILMSLIKKLHDIDYNVVGCVNNNGGGNVDFWSKCDWENLANFTYMGEFGPHTQIWNGKCVPKIKDFTNVWKLCANNRSGVPTVDLVC